MTCHCAVCGSFVWSYVDEMDETVQYVWCRGCHPDPKALQPRHTTQPGEVVQTDVSPVCVRIDAEVQRCFAGEYTHFVMPGAFETVSGRGAFARYAASVAQVFERLRAEQLIGGAEWEIQTEFPYAVSGRIRGPKTHDGPVSFMADPTWMRVRLKVVED